MPTYDGGWLDDVGDLLEGLPAEFLAQLCEGDALRIGEPEPTLDVCAEDPILSDEILVAFQQFLVDRARNVGEQLLPCHSALYIVR